MQVKSTVKMNSWIKRLTQAAVTALEMTAEAPAYRGGAGAGDAI